MDFVYHIHLRIPDLCLIVVMNTNSTLTPKPGNQLWGIYHTDREHARELGDPLRTVVEAPDKLAAEEAAGKLGFEAPWAHPIAADQVSQAQWLDEQKPKHRKTNSHKHSHGIRA